MPILSRIPILGKIFAQFGNAIAGRSSFTWNWGTPDSIVKRVALKANVGYVWTCVGAISSEVGRIQLKVVKPDREGTLKVLQHPFIRLLRKPNPWMSQYQLFELTSVFRRLTGEAFWFFRVGEISRKPREIFLLRPDLIQIVFNEKGWIRGYIYNLPDGTKIPLELDEVLHFKMPNPEDPTRGYGTVEAASIYMQTEEFASRFARNFIFNNARPGGILSVKSNMEQNDFDQLKAKFNQDFGTVDNAGKTFIIRNMDVGFTQLGTGLDNNAIKVAKEMSKDDILAMFRVSKTILGQNEGINRATAEAAEFNFAKRVIDPEMFSIADTIETYVDKTYGDEDIIVMYDSPVPEDKVFNLEEKKAAVNVWRTINQIRAEEDSPEISDGNQVYVPFNLQPVGEPIPERRSFGKIKIIKKKSIEKKKEGKFELSHEIKENFRVTLMKTQIFFSKKLQEIVNKFLDEQEKAILDTLRPKSIQDKAFEGILFEVSEETNKLADETRPLLIELARQQGPNALLLAGEKDLEFQITQVIQDTIADRTQRMGIGFNQGIKDQLETILTDAAVNGETLANTTKRIKGVYEDASKFRSERLARTETLNASTDATIEAYRQTGLQVQKEWFANPGACQWCRALDGKTISLETNFAELGTTLIGDQGGILNVDYDSVQGPPAHPNCTCTVVPVVR